MPTARDPSGRCVAIVVTFNSAVDLPACLATLASQRGVDLEIHVVDNASSDGSAELVRRAFPRVHLTVNETNLGFARANNQVLGRQHAAFFALLNPDTRADPNALVTCVRHMESHPDVGVVATRLVFPDESLQPSCHSFLGLRNLLGETFGAHHLAPGLRSLSSFSMPWFRHDRVAEVDWIQGAFLVLRGDAARAVGGFDPAFFMYGEEMDLCRRLRDAGWKTVFLPEPSVVHLGGASSAPIGGAMFVENLKGRLRYLRKHRGVLVAGLARVLIALATVLRCLAYETWALLRSVAGRAESAADRRRRSMFRSALRWVARGLPLSPPEAGARRAGGHLGPEGCPG